MVIDRAFVVLPVLPADVASLDGCLEHLVAAADEASAGGIVTTVLVAAVPVAAASAVLNPWQPLVSLVEGVDLRLVPVAGGADEDQALQRGAAEAAARCTAPRTTLLLATRPGVTVGTDWISEHARHHVAGATASTGPVRDGGATHALTANLALRMDAYLADGLRRSAWTLLHAVTPVVGPLRISLPTQA
ncbi:hypothetical protein [Kineococcus rubinsiae]|uniref:hypothetical protein n=1 Tax=Kineococcus rubinsiae TaxID=2609562 RepID=UPI001431F4F0|nr:hypothetical protein [Kineococcus rubinsiae]NIZ92196.1 hypothetical protein [Kineococcus rubinsiae]